MSQLRISVADLASTIDVARQRFDRLRNIRQEDIELRQARQDRTARSTPNEIVS